MHVSGSGPWQGLLEGCRTIYREDGMKGFYRGALCTMRFTLLLLHLDHMVAVRHQLSPNWMCNKVKEIENE